MNREIEFRGFDGGDWIYGSAVLYDETQDAWYLIEKDDPADEWMMVGHVGQFTGLYDKYQNKIYEDDILERFVPYEKWDTHEGDNIPFGSYTEKYDFGFRKERFKVVFYNGSVLAVPINTENWEIEWQFHVLELQSNMDYFEQVILREIDDLSEEEYEEFIKEKSIEEMLSDTEFVVVSNTHEENELKYL